MVDDGTPRSSMAARLLSRSSITGALTSRARANNSSRSASLLASVSAVSSATLYLDDVNRKSSVLCGKCSVLSVSDVHRKGCFHFLRSVSPSFRRAGQETCESNWRISKQTNTEIVMTTLTERWVQLSVSHFAPWVVTERAMAPLGRDLFKSVGRHLHLKIKPYTPFTPPPPRNRGNMRAPRSRPWTDSSHRVFRSGPSARSACTARRPAPPSRRTSAPAAPWRT